VFAVNQVKEGAAARRSRAATSADWQTWRKALMLARSHRFGNGLKNIFFGLLRLTGKSEIGINPKNKTADPDRFFRTGGFKSSTARC
jgi:hypothetical protein